MRETVLSICEKNFILNAASELKRLDGRKLDEFRNCDIYFGSDWGLCYVSLGETRVIAQVSCEVEQPKTTRPNEGLLYINVEVSSMAAPYIEPGRGSDFSNHLNRLLEKCLKDSKAIDLESLCLVAEEKVWALRVDVNILNHDGNLIEAASIASIAALAHFKRPDVTTNGEEIFIHDITERDPIPITLHHYPVCVTFALLNNGDNVLADPTSMEERVSNACLVFGINSYGEICGLHLSGNAVVGPNLVLNWAKKAANKAKQTVSAIKEALENDAKARMTKKCFGLVDYVRWDRIKSMSDSRLNIQLEKFKINSSHSDKPNSSSSIPHKDGSRPDIIDLGDNCAELVPVQHLEQEIKIICNEEYPEREDEVPEYNLHKTDDQIAEEKFFYDENYGGGGRSKWSPLKPDEEKKFVDVSKPLKVDPEVVLMETHPNVIESTEYEGDSEEEVIVLEPHDIDNPKITSATVGTESSSKTLNRDRGKANVLERSRDEKSNKKKTKKRK